jgi:iron complex outermembrane recepter protein
MIKIMFKLSSLGLAPLMVFLCAVSARAETSPTLPQPTTQPSSGVATSVREWNERIRQQTAQAEAAKVPVTNVRVERNARGLDITLETPAGKTLTIDASKFKLEGNTLVAEIANAVLALPSGQPFEVTNPAPDIAAVRVTQADGNRLQLSVVGRTAPPKTDVTLRVGGLAYALSPGSATTDEEVVVTGPGQRNYRVPDTAIGTGTNTRILDTPFTVQAIPQGVLRDQQVLRIEEALTNATGVNPAGNNAGRQSLFSVRGFGNQLDGGTPLLRDGFRLYGDFQGITETASLERVEVLRGPASVLFGELEPGGVINLVPKQPLPNTFREAELQVGSFGLVRPRLDLTGPLTQDGDLRYRLNLLYSRESGFRDFETDTNRFAISPVLSWKINARTDVSFSLDYLRQNSPADFGLTRFGDGVAPVSRGFVSNNPDDTLGTNFLSAGYNFEHRFNSNWKLRNGFRYISYDYNYSVLALPTSVEGNDIIRSFALQEGQQRSYSFNSSLVGQFNTGRLKHQLTIGADLNHSTSRIFTLFGEPTLLNIFNPNYDLLPKPNRADLPLFGDNRSTTNRLGIYVQDQISLLSNLILIAGFRYDAVTQTATNVPTNFVEGGRLQVSSSAIVPRVGLLYRPLPELSFFGSYSQSFKPSTALVEDGTILPPERGEGFEFGIKTELLNQKLLATLTYFDVTKQNIAVPDPNNPLLTVALGEQNSRGLEFDVTGEILPGWRVIASYAYTDAKVSKDLDEALLGNRIFGIPRHRANLWTTYEIQRGGLRGLGFGAGLEYGSNRFGDLANTFQVGDYLIGNAAVYYQRGDYRFAVNIRNLANANYIRAVSGNQGQIEPGEPFSVRGSFSFQF